LEENKRDLERLAKKLWRPPSFRPLPSRRSASWRDSHGRETMIESGKLFTDIPEALENEQFLNLFSAPGVRIERIVSTGHATPESEWLDQDWTECVALLAGAAAIQIEGEPSVRTLEPGDWLLIPRHTRHRVEWTDSTGATIWLAIHVGV
jgi:cupin 2 domain-containing protein